jgi:N-methylhydantoinase A
MADEIRLLTVARGYDPREFALIVLGGAGPLHGGPLARALGIPRIIVPLTPGVLSAFGLLVSNVEHDHAISFARSSGSVTAAELAEAYRRLEALGEADMRRDRVPADRVRVRHYADMRYLGQSYELEVELTGGDGQGQPFDDGVVQRMVEGFHQAHQRVYRQHNREGHVEFVNLRTVHYAPMPRPSLEPPPPGESWESAQISTRGVYFREIGDYQQVPVFRRERLPFDQPRSGPFIVEQADTTTVVFPFESAHVDRRGNLIVDMQPHA